MADYEGFDTAEYNDDHFTANSQSVKLQRRNTYFGVETVRTPTEVVEGASVITVFRGKLGGQLVYNVGSPPAGATDIVVISRTFQE